MPYEMTPTPRDYDKGKAPCLRSPVRMYLVKGAVQMHLYLGSTCVLHPTQVRAAERPRAAGAFGRSAIIKAQSFRVRRLTKERQDGRLKSTPSLVSGRSKGNLALGRRALGCAQR